jgi:hypothetical protein
MKANLRILLVLIPFILFQSVSPDKIFAGDKPAEKPFMKEIDKMKLKNKGGLFSLNIDIKLGLGISKSNFDLKNDTATQQLNSTGTVTGPSVGADVTINLLGFGFTTGILYSKKGFQTTNGTNYNFHYFVIPLLFYFNFDFGKVLIDGNLGPYFGLLLSQDAFTQNNIEVYKMKNFDLGLTANIQGTYMFTKILGVSLGYKFEYGGLNNLASNDNVNKLTTQTHFIYTGLKIML